MPTARVLQTIELPIGKAHVMAASARDFVDLCGSRLDLPILAKLVQPVDPSIRVTSHDIAELSPDLQDHIASIVATGFENVGDPQPGAAYDLLHPFEWCGTRVERIEIGPLEISRRTFRLRKKQHRGVAVIKATCRVASNQSLRIDDAFLAKMDAADFVRLGSLM